MPNTPLQGSLATYPAVPGARRQGFACKLGPASYTAISIAAPPTGGFLVNASDFGLVDIEFAYPAVSDNGQYVAFPMPAKAQNQPQTAIRYMIVVANGGAEASGDLSGKSFLFHAFGN
jgi:hypothetical protein